MLKDRGFRVFFDGAVVIAGILGFFLISRYNYLLFHSLIELVTIAVGFTLFIFSWNAREFLKNDSLKILGIGYAFIAGIDLFHTLAYKGMNVFPGQDANLATQLWIAARYLQAFTLCMAPFFVARKVSENAVVGGYVAAILALMVLLDTGSFPVCFVEGAGLTAFKIFSEYVITVLLFMAVFLFYRVRRHFDRKTYVFLVVSILLTAVSELSFTAYMSVYGFANMLGHLLKLGAFYFLYRALIVIGFVDPFELIFRDLKQAEETLKQAHDSLEEKVRERTAELRTSEAKYRMLIENANDAVFVNKIMGDGRAGRFIEVNDLACRRLGYSREELCGLGPADIDDPAYQHTALAVEARLNKDGHAVFETVQIAKDGRSIPVEVSSRVLELDGERFILSLARDITARKRAAVDLVRSEQNYREIFDAAANAFFLHDIKDGRLVDVNAAMLRMYGYQDKEEALACSADVMSAGQPPYSAVEAIAWLRRAVEEGPQKFEWMARRRTGELFWVEIELRYTSIGGCDRVLAVVRDINEHKLAEKALQESQASLEMAQSLAKMGSWDLDPALGAGQWSKEMYNLFGFDPDFGVPTLVDFMEVVHSEDRARCIEAHRQVLENGAPRQVDFRTDPARGSVRYFSSIIRLSDAVPGKARKLNGIAQDITDRKRAEEALARVHEQMRSIIEFLPDAVFVIDRNKKVVAWNHAIEVMSGVSKEKMLGQGDHAYAVPFFGRRQPLLIDFVESMPGELDPAYKFVNKLGDKVCAQLYLPRVYQGRGAHLWGVAAPLFDQHGACWGYIEVIRDMTDQVLATDRLRESEGRYRLLIETTTDYIYTVRVEDGRAVDTTHGIGCEGVTGYTTEDYVRDPDLWYRMIHDEDKKAVVDMAARALAGAPVEPVEHRILCKDGSVRWLRDTIVLRKDVDGRVIAYDGLVHDITERKASEEAVRKSEERYRLLDENMTDALWTTDLDMRFNFVSPPLTRLVGYGAEELMRMGLFDLLTPESARKVRAVFEQEMRIEAKEGHDPLWATLFELAYIRKNGLQVWCEVKATFIRNSLNKVVGIIGVTRDITERKAIEKTQRLVQLGKLVADVAHEVNNPLMIISGNAQLSLMEESRQGEIHESLKIILEECDRASNIIQRLLRFSRPGSGQFREMDINVSVDAIVGLVRHQFAIMNVRIEEDYAPGLPLVMADDKQIQEVVVNLLNNAREAMAGRGWVLVRTALDGDFVRIDVQDNGSGMTTETINKIWEPFFTTKDKGTGLGLPVCFGIIKAHKGELLCTSVPGQGTTMSILLPIPRKV